MTIQTIGDLYIGFVESPLHLVYADDESMDSMDFDDDDTSACSSYLELYDSLFYDDDDDSINLASLEGNERLSSAMQAVVSHDSLVLARSRGMGGSAGIDMDDQGAMLDDSIEVSLNDVLERKLKLRHELQDAGHSQMIALNDTGDNIQHLNDAEDLIISFASLSDGNEEVANPARRKYVGRGPTSE
jgi:hypothetical protein